MTTNQQMTQHKRLTPEQQQKFATDGYVVVDEVLSPDSFEALKRHFEEKLNALPEGQRPEDLDVPHFTDPELFRWLFDDGVLNLVEGILGPDIALFSSHFFCKPAGDGKRVPWHQDAYFWREQIVPAERAITLWLAIDPSTEENGCVRVIPGTHRAEHLHYSKLEDPSSVFNEELKQDEIDESQSVPIVVHPNQASIHSAGLIHGSTQNLSSIRRCGFTMRYISTDVKFNAEAVGDRHEIYLARGVDRAGNVYGDPDHPNAGLAAARGMGQTFVGAKKMM